MLGNEVSLSLSSPDSPSGPYKRKMGEVGGNGISGLGPESLSEAAVEGLSLVLTEEEAALFALLMEVVSHSKLGCILRVAGGWVRDKIMVCIPCTTIRQAV